MLAEAPPLPAIGHLDLPNGVLFGISPFLVAGWAVGGGAMRSVRVALDGEPCGEALTGIPRPDVARHYPQYPEALQSGFRLDQVRPRGAGGAFATLSLLIDFAEGETLLLEHRVPRLSRATDLLARLRAEPAEGPSSLLSAAELFIAGGAWDEAEALLGVAAARFPDDPEVATEYARLAARVVLAGAGPVEEATRRLAALQRRFPDRSRAGLDEVRALLGQQRFAEAELLLSHSIGAAEARPELLKLRATLAEQQAFRADAQGYNAAWRAAQQAWDAVLKAWPDHVPALIGAGQARIHGDRISEAERFLGDARRRLPAEPVLAMLHAHVPALRDDPAEALRRWEALRARFPDFRGGTDLEGQARLALAASEPAARQALPADVQSERDLMLCFESLGRNCEFGNVQRSFGAEPLGLFRFSSAPVADLVEALDCDLAGIGEPDHTSLELVPQPRPELWTHDRRWHFRAHTFIYPDEEMDEAARAALFAKHCKRLQYLRRKLLEDLAAAEKIMVHGEYDPAPPSARRRLLRALRRHGPNTLLYVMLADAAHPSGSVELVEPGLMVGRLDGFVGITRKTVNYADWLKICRAAHAMWPEARVAT